MIDYTKAVIKVFDKKKDTHELSVLGVLDLATCAYEVVKAVNSQYPVKELDLANEAAVNHSIKT
jgi:hypothetical protein